MKSYLPVAGSVAAVAAVAVGVTLVSSTSGGADGPAPLRLASGGTGAEHDSAAAARSSSGTGSGYTLTGALPAGQPDDAPAYRLADGPADADVVAALARALRAGTPVRDGDGWRAGGLLVSGDAGQSWWYSPCARDMAVSSDSRVGCAVATPGGVPAPGVSPDSRDGSEPDSGGGSEPDVGSTDGSTDGSAGSGVSTGSGSGTSVAPPPPSPAPEPEPMTKDEVRSAAAPVFQALGLDASAARVEGWPYGGSATLLREVGGLEAHGLQTSVQVDREGKVQSANGFLGAPEKGDSYPLVTAQAAYDELPPMMTTMMCPVGPDGKGCLPPEPTEVTGAHLGLMLSPLADGGMALVPAWLFEVKGWTDSLPVVAVQKAYLPEPEQPTSKPDPGDGTPGAVPPAPPAVSDPGAARESFSFDKAARGDQPNQLVVTYGDSSSCPHENVEAMAKESADAVYVVLEADARDPGVACTEDYRAVERTITLQAPLGDRKVVDTASSKEVPLS